MSLVFQNFDYFLKIGKQVSGKTIYGRKFGNHIESVLKIKEKFKRCYFVNEAQKTLKIESLVA